MGVTAANEKLWEMAKEAIVNDHLARYGYVMEDVYFTDVAHYYEQLKMKGSAKMKRISIDNGYHWIDPEEALENVELDALAVFMDFDTIEAVHAEGPESDLAFLTRYLELAPDDLIFG